MYTDAGLRYNDFNIKIVGGLIIMTAHILLILVLVATIIPVCLLFGIPASKYNKKVQKEETEERQ